MVSVILPFLMSILLGRTIDLRTYDVGGDIYDHNDYTEVPLKVLNSTYTILDPQVVPYRHIGLPADLILRIKSHHLNSASGSLGLDGLLKTSWKSSSTIVAVSTMYQTVYKRLSEDAQLLRHWTERILRSRTHYASSTIYGGWSFIMYKIICSHPEDDETVNKILKEKLGLTGTLSEKTIDLWKEAFEAIRNHPDLKNKVDIQVKRFASHPLAADISTPDKLWDAIQKFVKNVEIEEHPLFVEFKPLHKLDNRFPSVRPNHMLDRDMEVIDEMFDDLRYTEAVMRKWISKSLTEFTDEQENTILKFFTHLRTTYDLFDSVAANASIYNRMDTDYIKSAILMYHRGLTKQTNSYQMLFQRLKEEIDPQCDDTFLHGVKGILNVPHNERIELGEMVDSLEECKKECIEEPKCRAIGYADKMPVYEYDHSIRGLKLIKEARQCFLFFRSSSTTTFVPAKTERMMKVYDRRCY